MTNLSDLTEKSANLKNDHNLNVKGKSYLI